MEPGYKSLTNFLVDLGIDKVAHSNKTYLAHLVAVYKFMEHEGCSPDLCRAGMFHSIYGTEKFQGFKLELDQRPLVRDLIGERPERLAYLNCFMDRVTLDRALEQSEGPYAISLRETEGIVELDQRDFDDLCRIHLYDWLEQAPRSRFGWDYRRTAYRLMAERLGLTEAYDRVFALETNPAGAHA